MEYNEFSSNIKVFLKKINSKLIQKERTFNMNDIIKFYSIYSDMLDIKINDFKYNYLNKHKNIQTYMFICVNYNEEKLKITKTFQEKYIDFINQNI